VRVSGSEEEKEKKGAELCWARLIPHRTM
jgi:hypothetical protein